MTLGDITMIWHDSFPYFLGMENPPKTFDITLRNYAMSNTKV